MVLSGPLQQPAPLSNLTKMDKFHRDSKLNASLVSDNFANLSLIQASPGQSILAPTKSHNYNGLSQTRSNAVRLK